MLFFTTPKQDQQIEQYIQSEVAHPGPYRVTGPNCATAAEDALQVGGTHLPYAIRPSALMDELHGLPGIHLSPILQYLQSQVPP